MVIFFPPAVRSIRFLIAYTGHKEELSRAGIFNIRIVSLVCLPGLAKKTSPLAICWIGENALIERGTRFEMHKNEKINEYNA